MKSLKNTIVTIAINDVTIPKALEVYYLFL